MIQFAWTFPGGKVLVDTVPATAGNASDTFTVPTGKLVSLLSILVEITTDATVANRYIQIAITDGTNTLFNNKSNVITASTTTKKYFSLGFVGGSADFNGLLSDNLLPAGYKLIISVISGVVGDSFEGFTWYKEIDAP